MRALQIRVGLCDLGSGLPEAKAELTEQSLALPHLQRHVQFTPEKCRQCRAIPHFGRQAELRWAGAQCRFNLSQLLFVQAGRPARSLAFRDSGQPLRLKALHPIHNRPWRITQKLRHVGTGHPLRDKQNPMKSVIVTRHVIAPNFIL